MAVPEVNFEPENLEQHSETCFTYCLSHREHPHLSSTSLETKQAWFNHSKPPLLTAQLELL